MTLLEWCLNPISYAFSAINNLAASGNLASSGSGKVITLTPMPHGLVSGNKVRISGGSGTAEAVAITAVSGVGGAATGTITVTTSNTHTGAWVVGSASSGIQEAVVAAGATGTVYMPSGTYNVYATINVPDNYTKFNLRGAGPYNTTLVNQTTTQDVLSWLVPAGYIGLYDFGVLGQATATNGWGIKVGPATFGQISNVYIVSGHKGLYLANPNSLHVENVIGYGLLSIGMQLDALAGGVVVSEFNHCNFFTSHTGGDIAALYITVAANGTVAGPIFTGCQFTGFNHAVYATTSGNAVANINEVSFVGGAITGHVYGVRVVATGAGSGAYGWKLVGLQYLASVGSGANSGPAIALDEGTSRFLVSNSTIESNGTFSVISLRGPNFVTIIDNVIFAHESTLANGVSIEQGAGAVNCSHIRIVNNEIGYMVGGTVIGRWAVSTTNDAHSFITVQNNQLAGATAALNFNATGASSYIAGNMIDPASGSPGKPTASAAIRGSTWYTPGGAGVADLYEICRKDSANAYAWTALF